LIEFLVRDAPLPSDKDTGKQITRGRQPRGDGRVDRLRQTIEQRDQFGCREFPAPPQQPYDAEAMDPFTDEVSLFDREMVESDDLRVSAGLGRGEDILEIPAFRRLRIELPVEDLHGDKLPRLRIARLKQSTAAARLGFVQQFVATREEVSVHLEW